jgi:hypothetical protein
MARSRTSRSGLHRTMNQVDHLVELGNMTLQVLLKVVEEQYDRRAVARFLAGLRPALDILPAAVAVVRSPHLAATVGTRYSAGVDAVAAVERRLQSHAV